MMKHLATAFFNHSQSHMLTDEADSVQNFVRQGFDVHHADRRNKWQLRLQQRCFKEE